MTQRPYSAAIVAEFLEDVLAAGGVGVPDLELMARAAGLLGEHQRVSHAKMFKKAKRALGIKSVRNGFGAGGQWLWCLDKQDSPHVTETSAQRLARSVAIENTYAELQRDVADNPRDARADVLVRRAPSSWVEGVARLDSHCPFIGIPPHRWRQFLTDCNIFLSSDEYWAERAAQLGWDALAVFGCRHDHALSHLGSSGLMWVINGGRLVELHPDWAIIELAVNGSRRIFDRRRVDAAKVTLPWIEHCRRSDDN